MEQQGINDVAIKTDQKVTPRGIVKIGDTEIQANTATGAAWVRKYEHPPAGTPADYAGIPDINNSPSVRTEYRAVQNVQTYDTVGTVTTNYNKVLFLQLPSMTVPTFAFKYNTSGVRAQLAADVVHNQGIATRQHLANFGSGRIAYKSCTYSLNATDFNNQGIVTVAQFRPNISSYNYASFAEYVRGRMSKARADTFLASLKKSARADTDDFVDVSSDKLGDATGNSYLVITIGKVPVNSTDVAQLSPNATVNPAKEGAFVVQRFSQPVVEYRDYAFAAQSVSKPAPIVGSGVLLEYIDAAGVVTFATISDTYYPSNTVLEDIALFDFTCAWVHFEGLSVQPASTTATTVTPPYITVKAITGVEAQALPGSMFTPFMENSAVYDSRALEFASMVTHARQDSLPARFNFWGALGSALLQAAPSIISTVKGLFGKKESDKEKQVTRAEVDKLAGMLKKSRVANAPSKKAKRRTKSAPPPNQSQMAPKAQRSRPRNAQPRAPAPKPRRNKPHAKQA